jgi:hypothetical protein
MKGQNQVWLSGYVGGRIITGRTGGGNQAYSFALKSEDSGNNVTRVRVNAYGAIARKCMRELEKGHYCSVLGELMNRAGKYGELTEIRAKKIDVFPSISGENDGGCDDRQEERPG